MKMHIRAPGAASYVELEPTKHILAKELCQGIGPERVREIMMKQ